ncbi:MAG: DUF805 domain-containing protein [Burkholderiaceae bacterium]|jgi:uncharacterized membrane protein YhaH (DUF805 family)
MEWMLLPFRRYAEFSGRSRRKEFWMFGLLTVMVYAVGGSLMLAGGLASAWTETEPTFGPLFWVGVAVLGLYGLAIFIPSIALTVRRLHDRDMSGWWYLGVIVLGSIPYVGWLVNLAFLVLMCLEGTQGPNRFGPDPKDRGSMAVFA